MISSFNGMFYLCVNEIKLKCPDNWMLIAMVTRQLVKEGADMELIPRINASKILITKGTIIEDFAMNKLREGIVNHCMMIFSISPRASHRGPR